MTDTLHHTQLARLGIDPEEWKALRAIARAAHPTGGLQAGFCICGAAGPTTAACRALRDLVDLAELAERQTR